MSQSQESGARIILPSSPYGLATSQLRNPSDNEHDEPGQLISTYLRIIVLTLTFSGARSLLESQQAQSGPEASAARQNPRSSTLFSSVDRFLRSDDETPLTKRRKPHATPHDANEDDEHLEKEDEELVGGSEKSSVDQPYEESMEDEDDNHEREGDDNNLREEDDRILDVPKAGEDPVESSMTMTLEGGYVSGTGVGFEDLSWHSKIWLEK